MQQLRNDARYLLAIGGLVLLLAGAVKVIVAQQVVIDTKPKVEIRTVTKVETRRVAGPVRIVQTVRVLPSGEKITERTTDRAAVTTDTHRDAAAERIERPACPPARRAATRWVHVTLDPQDQFKPRAAAVGLTLWDRVDAGASADWRYKAVGVQLGGRW